MDPIIPRIDNENITISFGGIAFDDAEYLWNFSNDNPGYKASFPKGNIILPIKRAKTISAFSSWGLGPDLSVKPDISAPGGDIFSTYPLTMGGYATMSGTSMASPYAAGIVANMFGTNTPETVARQGGGLINIEQVLGATTLIFPEQIRLNNNNRNGVFSPYTVTFKNYDTKPVIYSLSHMPAGSAQGYANDYSTINPFPLPEPILLTNHEVEAIVEFPVKFFEIPSKQQANIIINISLPPTPPGLPPTIYSGFIVVQSSNKNFNQYIPYAGLTTDIRTLPVLNINNTSPYISAVTATANEPVALVAKMIGGSPLITVMVVNARNPSKVYGFLPNGADVFIARNNPVNPEDSYVIYWNGIIRRKLPGEAFNPTVNPRNPIYINVAPGYYRLRIMALRVFGVPEKAEDYDSWISPVIYYE